MASLSTRKQIRRRVGRLTGDSFVLTASSVGTTTTLIDSVHGSVPDGFWLNRHGIFSGGTAGNLGRIVRVTDNLKSTQTVTFTPTLPFATQIGDEMELWNERDEGITPVVVHELINDAIMDVADRAITPVTSDELSFSGDSPVIAIDDLELNSVVVGDTWELVVGIDRWDGESLWIEIDQADLQVDRYARTIEIKNRNRWLADAYNKIRVRGAQSASPLTADTDSTPVDYEWITHQVAAAALGLRLEKAYDRKDVEGRLLQLQARADMLRPKTSLQLKGRYKRLS